MPAFDRDERTLKYLRLLSQQFPNQQAAFSEIINLQAILNLPKGTEHFMSDIHGEYEAFMHIVNNCSGVVREHVDVVFGDTLSSAERAELCTLIYYPTEKLARIQADHADTPAWYRDTLAKLVRVARRLSARYTRSKVRKALPAEYAYIIDELLHTHPDEENYRVRYHDRIIASILETGAAADFISSLAALIKRLAVDRLHIVGDIFDRGAHADKIMDVLMGYHALDIQWGNHDILWMGAAAGEPACIMTVLRNNLRYDNFEILENGYGIGLRELALFAERTYTRDESEIESTGLTPIVKAIDVMLAKLEGQIVMRHPEFDMADRLLLDKMDLAQGTVTIDGVAHPLATCDFPTVDPAHPYELSREEQALVEGLVEAFRGNARLQRHIAFLYERGSVYLRCNGNLLFHGCVPMNEDGTFAAILSDGEQHAGRCLFDFCDTVARRAWRTRETRDLDWMWYLWCGRTSPLSGRVVKTFERSFVPDRATWAEPADPYYRLSQEPAICRSILRAFDMPAEHGHIVNGHTPVRAKEGEEPVRADGKLLMIDGGFCSAYHRTTGLAGYTLIYSSHGMRIKAHQPFESIEKALDENADIASVTDSFETEQRTIMVSETDTGDSIREQIDDLRRLLSAYRNGVLPERRLA